MVGTFGMGISQAKEPLRYSTEINMKYITQTTPAQARQIKRDTLTLKVAEAVNEDGSATIDEV